MDEPPAAFFGLIPDYRGLAIVQAHKDAFDASASEIAAKGLHKTTIAAAIAVQSQWLSYPPDLITYFAYKKSMEGCSNPLIDFILNDLSSSVGFAKVPNGVAGQYGNLYLMENSIKAMTDRIYESTKNCANCNPIDTLMIAGMAQNGGGFRYVPNKDLIIKGRIRWGDYLHSIGADTALKLTDNEGNKRWNV